MASDYDTIMESLKSGTPEDWEEISSYISDFPHGKDDFIQRNWIINAIDCGSFESIKWMVSKGVNLNCESDEGFPPVHSVLYRDETDRYDVLNFLIESGIDINQRGSNDYTPLHCAAIKEDFKAMEILLDTGADYTIRTQIDEYATAIEEARMLGKLKSAEFIENWIKDKNKKDLEKLKNNKWYLGGKKE